MSNHLQQREIRYTYVRKMLTEGLTSFGAQKACKAKFNVGIGYDTVRRLAAQVAEAGEVSKAEEAITPIMLPTEILKPEDPSHALVAPEPNGATANLRGVQQWMRSVGAEQLSLNADGQVSVLVRHNFDIGEPG